MKTRFSQRQGLKPVRETLLVDNISTDLKNLLWTTLWLKFFVANQLTNGGMLSTNIRRFYMDFWVVFLKEAIDTLPHHTDELVPRVRNYFFASEWYESYDLLEYIAGVAETYEKPIYAEVNAVLGKEYSAYRFVNGLLTQITSDGEVAALEEATNPEFGHASVSAHLQRALELYSDRQNPDYRNSIKESISAVESMAKIATGNPKATLGAALKSLAKNGKLHESLNIGFQKLYGYSSEEDGIRHAMMNDPNLTAADAKYFLLSCTSFVNYLKSKM